MKLHRILLPVLTAAILAAAPGCKKENTETKSFEGYLSIKMPSFIEVGDIKLFQVDTMMTLICPDGEPIGYYFYDANTGKSDTLVTADGVIREHYYLYTAPDKLGVFSLTFGGFPAKNSSYEATRTSISFVVVRPGLSGEGSITNFDKKSSKTFTDYRDGRRYYYTTIGTQQWMRQNLAWTGSGRAIDGCEVMTDVFGRYYTWEEAQTACPDGWYLPSDADWTALQEGAEAGKDVPGLAGRIMGDLYFNGAKMWEYWRDVKITDELRLSIMPVGYGQMEENKCDFDGLYSYAAFWTSDEADGQGVCRYIYQDKDIVYRGLMPKTDFAASVRCIRE